MQNQAIPGGGNIFYYTPDATPLTPPADLASATITDLTTDPDKERPGVRLADGDVVTVELAYLGMDTLHGGLAITAKNNPVSHTLGTGAKGILLNNVIMPAKVLGVIVFINGQASVFFPQLPANRAAQTQSTPDIPVYYKASSNALLAADVAAKALYSVNAYGIKRNSLPDTTDETQKVNAKQKVTMTPAHSGDYDVVSGVNISFTSKLIGHDDYAMALVNGALYTNLAGVKTKWEGFAGAGIAKYLPLEVHLPSGDSGKVDVYFIPCAECETTDSTIGGGKTAKPEVPITIKQVPDDLLNELQSVVCQQY